MKLELEHHLENAFDLAFPDWRERPGMAETPRRVAALWREFSRPKTDLDEILSKSFETASSAMVIQTKIPFRGLCEHHLFPFSGECAIGYIPNGEVIGLSKLARLVRALGAAHPTIQEDLTDEIADTLQTKLSPSPRGVIVVVSAEHTCMTCRGALAPGVRTITSALRGSFEEPAVRAEFYSLVGMVS